MRRGAKPTKARGKAKLPVARKSLRNESSRVRDLEKHLEAALKREAEALEQQTATSEILRVISSSPTDVQPVFDTIVTSAGRLCGAESAVVYRFQDEMVDAVALYNLNPDAIEAYRRRFPRRLRDTDYLWRVADGSVLNIADIAEHPHTATTLEVKEPRFVGGMRVTDEETIFRSRHIRSLVLVPMVREEQAIGVIGVSHHDVGAFSDERVRLLRTFAAQAVIAIENVRLFNETKEALGQQTATGEILRVISSSPTNIQPVFDAIVTIGTRLCEASYGFLARYDGHMMTLVAQYNATNEEMDTVLQVYPRPAGPDSLGGRTILERAVVHVPDVSSDPTYGLRAIQDAGWRTFLGVPLLRGGTAIGALGLWRRQARSFSDQQIKLLQTFADQAVIAIENVRLFNETKEALERQTATSEILRVISSSPTDVQPVFEAIAESATRLLHGWSTAVLRLDDDSLHVAATHGGLPGSADTIRQMFPVLPVTREQFFADTILGRQVKVIEDVECEESSTLREIARVRGWRANLAVPMLREGQPIGLISVTRVDPGPFAPREIQLLQTFAEQAVIAIENVRLFNETKEALERQTATAEILRVIASSPTDVQPVFDTIVTRAARLCDAAHVSIYRVEGDILRHMAMHGAPVGGAHLAGIGRTLPIDRTTSPGRAVIAGQTVHLVDAWQDPDASEELRALVLRDNVRTVLTIPLLREGRAIGAILIRRTEVRAFTEKELQLLKTFADQAVIAIENVRLFTELQASNRELTTALDTQTATSDILRVISRSQTDVQPVFDAIVDSAVRLLGAYAGALTRVAGDQIELAALTSTDDAADAAVRALFPQSLQSELPHPQAIRDRAPLNVADAPTDPRLPEAVRAVARARGYRSLVAVPLLRHDAAVGAISVTRRDPGGFNDDEIALLKTFADQAVIAIENARLLTELQARTEELTRSVGELRALGEVGQAISSTLDLQTVLSTIIARATQLAGVDAGVMYEYDEQREVFEPRATERLEEDIVQMLVATPVRKGQGATGRLAEVPEPIQVADVRDITEQIPVRDALVRAGYRALLAVPLVREDHLLGGLTVFRKTPGAFAQGTVDLLRTFATQSALAIQNARLFREIEAKGRQLEAASQHKSEFLANMSHELRTPLNAIIGFSEVLVERMFGELNEKQDEYLKDIYSSGTHLLSLINDILDLSKIEAGRMELELTEFDLPSAIENALILVRERATRRGITLERSIDERLESIRADERKIKQVLLNLLSNAIKFTPEGGRIDVKAGLVDGAVEISVTDTGVGIAPEDQEAVFEEFRQVGRADKKAEGTGLGLALCRKFVELHGGRIGVRSLVGAGSTFTFALPVRS